MNFRFTEEQSLLRTSLQRFLAAEYGFEARRAASRSEAGLRREVWTALARDLGILGAGLPPRLGGLGGGPVEHMIIMEELGRALVLEPYLETIVVGAELLARSPSPLAEAVLREVAAGNRLLAFAWAEPGMRYDPADVVATAMRDGAGWRLQGRKSMVVAAPWTDALIVLARTAGAPGQTDGLALFLVDRDRGGVTMHPYPTIDGRRAADVILDNVSLPADALLIEQAGPVVDDILERAIAALAAEAVGVLSRLQEDVVQYLGQRRQFGQPLSDFQALQHRSVDMFMQVEMARSAAYLATLRLASSPDVRALAVSAAKVTVGKACQFVGTNAVQLHGGMGMTDDLPVGHYFKRALMIEAEFGDIDHHVARYAALSRTAHAAGETAPPT
jgi:alkylation response protein AidB-like acyl-CoA dehydrogenase